MRMVYGDGPTAPRCSPAEVLAVCGLDGPVDVLLGWTPERLDWIDDPAFRADTLLAGYGLGRAVAEGRVTPLPVRLSSAPALLRDLDIEIAVVPGVVRGGGHAFHGAIGWADVAARTAQRVVVEVDPNGVDLGAPLIEGETVATIERDAPVPPVSLREPDEIDRAIAAHVVSLLPDDATVQFGLGAVPDAIAAAIDRPVSIWTGLVTDAMASIHERGLLTAPAVATYTWGRDPIARLHADGMLELRPVSETHDIGRLARIPRLFAVNAALQVRLDGAVNTERVAGRTLAGVGGHADFSLGAHRSPGGRSIVALRSTDRWGGSTIVPEIEVVSTQRSDVDVVVTEHGIADLRGVGDAERARRLAAIAG